jgi:hypothetical protein
MSSKTEATASLNLKSSTRSLGFANTRSMDLMMVLVAGTA